MLRCRGVFPLPSWALTSAPCWSRLLATLSIPWGVPWEALKPATMCRAVSFSRGTAKSTDALCSTRNSAENSSPLSMALCSNV
uniref:Putative secreted protein n=1 Tax=Ixodes ricinus TaxID=34613 RepID=A0A6B0U6D8_IXORI